MELAIIALHDLNLGIGKNDQLLCAIPDDLKRLKRLTMGDQENGYPLIMGRRTFDSIVSRNGKLLPKRPHIVMSKNPCFRYPGVHVAENFEQALELALLHSNKIFIFGGGQVYQQAIGYTDRLYLTVVQKVYEADTFFPLYQGRFRETNRESDEHNGIEYEFVDYVKQ